MTTWQPRSTAPKCGPSFLAYNRNQHWFGVAWWNPVYEHYEYTGGAVLWEFTHWMPIPPVDEEP